MINLFYWTTPNGHKITIFLEEAGIPYTLHPINLSLGEQFAPEFLRTSPNNKIPAIIDQAPLDGGEPISIFESGAILLYLADKTKKFITENIRERVDVLQWLFWQVGGLGPMAGQNHHFSHAAPEVIPYAIERYVKETTRLYTVLNKRLADREFIAKQYSIADIACYPWVAMYEKQQQDLNDFKNIKRWLETIQARPAVKRAYAIAEEIQNKAAAANNNKSCPLPGAKAKEERSK